MYVIKFNNGCYWSGYNSCSPQLRKAIIYNSYKNALQSAQDTLSRRGSIKILDNSKSLIDTNITDYRIHKIGLNDLGEA